MVHILLIEDNPGDVLMIREALRASPIPADVVIAYDGEEGLRLLKEEKVPADFVILDLNLPKCSGLAILEQHRDKDGPPVVVLTGSPNASDAERAKELGVRDYVIKPQGFQPFIKAVQGILERWASPPKPAPSQA
jgi:DNA-binding response OmpR family regulator